MGKSPKEHLDGSFIPSVLAGEFNSAENSHVGQPTLKKKKKKKCLKKNMGGGECKYFYYFFIINFFVYYYYFFNKSKIQK